MRSSARLPPDPSTHSCRDGLNVGVLNIDKPKGLTSHDVVVSVRRLSGQQRVGHAGTLDPMATGVLVVCLGKATRIVEYLMGSAKSYLGTVRFGVITETWDAEGRVLEERDCEGLSLEAIQRALPRFTGRIEQVPPMYSALKRQGQPLYRLARQGITVPRNPRTVEVHSLRIMSWQSPELVLRIDCSTGTYVRALAHDLGQVLGAGAHLSGLTRLAVGDFRLEGAVSLDTLWSERHSDLWRRHLVPIRVALGHMHSVTLDEDTARRVRFGQAVKLTLAQDAQLYCAYDRQRRLIAILKPDRKNGLWRPHKVLATS